MAEPLKNIYNRSFFDDFLKNVPEVDPSVFLTKIFDKDWENRELKQRMRHIALTLGESLPSDFASAIKILEDCVDRKRGNGHNEMNFPYMFIPDFIEVFGINHYKQSVHAIEHVTQFTSCEFVVRPFLIRYGEPMMQQMHLWSLHKEPMVRRLATEGMRPRLPWAMAVPNLKADPSPILPILENLKSDPSESVRRSVANNLNDIAKDHPQIVLDIVEKWRGISPETDWLIRHGSRTLLKRGNTDSLQSFGFQSNTPIEIQNFALEKAVVQISDSLFFHFNAQNTSHTEGYKIRLEFGVDYVKANGKTSRKIFQITERFFEPNEVWICQKQLSFKDLTTRKHHLGTHNIAIIVNGVEKTALSFDLVE
jgi:3-methyladenine DNA glycosylase AlkC